MDEELAYIKNSAKHRLIALRTHLGNHPHLLPTLEHLLERYDLVRSHEELRSLQGLLASLLTAIDWQSPSFLHALRSQAGVQTGKIVGTVNDYKRDQHLDASAFERAFAKEYIDAPLRLGPSVYATSSGMAAFTTILTFLQHNGKTNGDILVGQNSYFENKGLLKKAFPNRVHFVDEMDTDRMIRSVREREPSIIFLDTLCNTEEIAVPNLYEFIPALAKTIKRHAYLVLDNSGMGPMCQPLKNFPRLNLKLHLLVFESLNKFYQFGMDRVTGGVIWGIGNDTLGIMSTRTRLGTNIPDASAWALPEPNRLLLERRMRRIGDNAQYVAETLDKYITSHPRCAFACVTYPGLPSYRGYAWTRTRPFHGAFFTLNFKQNGRVVGRAKHFLTSAIEHAQRANVELIAGTSFGFNVTRVYLTALKAQKEAKPFLRISVGTENHEQIEKLIAVFKRTIDAC